jgi:hypothetical protein
MGAPKTNETRKEQNEIEFEKDEGPPDQSAEADRFAAERVGTEGSKEG